jgi:hypothetical protein
MRRAKGLGLLAAAVVAVLCFVLASRSLVGQAPSASREIHLSVIVVASEPTARDIVERLKNGEDFAALAKMLSTDSTAPYGGYAGSVDPANLLPELQEALRGVAVGQVSPITKVPTGYAILKVLDAEPPKLSQANTGPAGMGARPTYDNGGYTEALRALSRFTKPPGWNHDVQYCCKTLRQSVEDNIAKLKTFVADPNLDAPSAVYLNNILALLLSWRGDMPEAIAYLEADYQLALTKSPQHVLPLEEALGIVYLHSAGIRLYQLYVFPRPLSPSVATPQEQDNLQKASAHFVRYLKRQPDDLEVTYLLNLTHMLLGSYPASVPKEYLIPPAALESKEDIGRFPDVAAAAGIDSFGEAGGAIVDDFDNDGFFDVVVSGMDDCQPLQLFHNNGNGTFTNRAAQAGIANQTGGLNIIHTDYNNDGCLDIMVLRGGWEFPRPKSLLRNNCNGTFTDVTRESGLLEPLTATQTGVWTDIDNDGKLDLFIASENLPAQLFLNKGDGTFVDIAHSAGVDRNTFAKSVAAGDYDHDGYVDLYVSSFRGPHLLYHNNHDRTFTEVSRKAGVESQAATFGSWFFDYDNDGWEDLFVAGYFLSVDDVMRGYLGLPQKGEHLQLFKNQRNGTFRDVSAEVGLNIVLMPMGLNFGDLDSDGFLDFYLGSGNPSYATPITNVLFHNVEGKRFVDITASSEIGRAHV